MSGEEVGRMLNISRAGESFAASRGESLVAEDLTPFCLLLFNILTASPGLTLAPP